MQRKPKRFGPNDERKSENIELISEIALEVSLLKPSLGNIPKLKTCCFGAHPFPSSGVSSPLTSHFGSIGSTGAKVWHGYAWVIPKGSCLTSHIPYESMVNSLKNNIVEIMGLIEF